MPTFPLFVVFLLSVKGNDLIIEKSLMVCYPDICINAIIMAASKKWQESECFFCCCLVLKVNLLHSL